MKLFCGQAPQWLKEAFLANGLELHEVGRCNALPSPVSHHIDLMAVNFDDKLYVTEATSHLLKKCDRELVVVKEELGNKYPKDVPLNVAFVGKYLICNTKTISKEILNAARESGVEVLPVSQGYTKCSTLVINEHAIITEDDSIYAETKDKLNVLKIQKGYFELPGYNYGFVGGASCSVGNNLYFFGNISAHPDYKLIVDFAENLGYQIVCLGHENKLLDIGGVIVL